MKTIAPVRAMTGEGGLATFRHPSFFIVERGEFYSLELDDDDVVAIFRSSSDFRYENVG